MAIYFYFDIVRHFFLSRSWAIIQFFSFFFSLPLIANRILDALSSDKRASIKINGEEFSRNQDGFNLVVVDYDTGAVESSENFDTTQDSGSAKSMTNFLRSLGNKKIIIGATKGNAGQFMFNDVYKSLVSNEQNFMYGTNV